MRSLGLSAAELAAGLGGAAGAPAGSAPAQCLGCQHWQQRGGTILPAGPSCVALSSDPMTPRMRALLLLLALQLARAGACPMFEALEAGPDAYRSEDLPRDEESPELGPEFFASAVVTQPGGSLIGAARRASQSSRRRKPRGG